MKTIVFIGTNRFGTSREALSAAKEMGYNIVLFTNKINHIKKTGEFPDVNHFVYIRNLLDEKKVMDEMTKLMETGNQICACVSFIDPFVSFAARISKHLGLVNLSEESLYIMENKIRFREKLKNLSVSPFYAVFNHDFPVEHVAQKYEPLFPMILKPPASNGSKDVLLVDTKEKFIDGMKYLQKKHPTIPVLIEEYLLGPQYLIEIIVHNNVMTVVGVIEQEIANNGRFIVSGYTFPAMLNNEEYQTLLVSVESIVDQIGLSSGSCHLEMRKVHDEWKLVEINPRMSGGAMNRIIEEGIGINLIKEILKMHLGELPSPAASQKQHVYAIYLTINSPGKLLKVTGVDNAWKHNEVKYVFVSPQEGNILTSPSSMGDRYACIIAASESPEKAKSIAIDAAMEIKFYLESL